MTASRHLKAAPSRAYPENYAYEDHGCDVAPSCLRCPLERCKYEMTPYEAKALVAKQRAQRINAALRGGQ